MILETQDKELQKIQKQRDHEKKSYQKHKVKYRSMNFWRKLKKTYVDDVVVMKMRIYLLDRNVPFEDFENWSGISLTDTNSN